MAKYTITHTCGHEETLYLVGKHTMRDATCERERARICRECWIAAQTAKAAEASSELPALTGSEKQINWALQLRVTRLNELKEFFAKKETLCLAQKPEDISKLIELRDRVISLAIGHTDAKFWIDSRGESIKMFLA